MASDETGLGFKAPHPGSILKEDVLPELNMTVEQFADHLGMKRANLSAILNGKRAISTDVAIRLGKALQTGTRYWLAMQMQYDLSHDIPNKASLIDVKPFDGFDGAVA
jgi:addiction module HigA family antidote